ncbi:MAG: hypothetical protein K0R71_2334 [Bacillales bacterium]|jgi:hypothetical protein|nr:hypothetical protein [Bacillales bacterium]
MKTNDYVKFITIELVKYLDEPKDIRKQKKNQKKAEQPPRMQRWFGVIPMSLSLYYSEVKEKLANKS